MNEDYRKFFLGDWNFTVKIKDFSQESVSRAIEELKDETSKREGLQWQ